MKRLKLCLVVLSVFFILFFSGITVGDLGQNVFVDLDGNELVLDVNGDFYFVHITDTHVRHKLFDRGEVTKKILESVIDEVNSFSDKPIFVVITGDLVEWGGSGIFGAFNYQTFVDCFYEKDNQLYVDEEYSIPVYTTPGNHDYMFNRDLKNYHRFVDRNHIYDNDRYVVTYGDVSLFFMDSGPNYYAKPLDWFDILGDGLYDCDIEWLEGVLSDCSSEHKIVLMHHPAVNYRNKWGEMVGVIARNREAFVELCEEYNVDVVLAGHTHKAVVFDGDENVYDDLPLSCSLYPTLHVQSDDCKEGCHYRNISVIGDDIWIGPSDKIEVTSIDVDVNYALIESEYGLEIFQLTPLTAGGEYEFLEDFLYTN